MTIIKGPRAGLNNISVEPQNFLLCAACANVAGVSAAPVIGACAVCGAAEDRFGLPPGAAFPATAGDVGVALRTYMERLEMAVRRAASQGQAPIKPAAQRLPPGSSAALSPGFRRFGRPPRG